MTISCRPSVLLPGTIISGKWNGKQYKIIKLLGEGANGRVYLVERNQTCFALKMGFDWLDHQFEVNAIKAQQRDGQAPLLLDADDFHWRGQNFSFYVMRYIDGQSPDAFLKKHGMECLSVIGLHLLRQLRKFHENGFVFGDLKPENVLVTKYGEVQLVDYGGVSKAGSSVRQFTERYDRGYWGGGSRTADEGYDIFSFCVLCIQLTNPSGLRAAAEASWERKPHHLLELARQTPPLSRWLPFFQKGLTGRFASSSEAAALWKELIKPKKIHENAAVTRRLTEALIIMLILFASALLFVLK